MRQIVALCVLVGAALLLGSGIVLAQCNGCAGDRNGDEQVTIDELVKAVNRALTGCGDNVACMSDGDCDPAIMASLGRAQAALCLRSASRSYRRR